MKKVKYAGSVGADLPTLGLFVLPGDVIDVPDDFNNSQFEDVQEKQSPVKASESKEADK